MFDPSTAGAEATVAPPGAHRQMRDEMPTRDELMTRLRGEASDCYSWSNGPGDRYPAHNHAYEKVLYCVDGSITFGLEADGRRIELKATDRMVLPAGTIHSAVVGPAGCTCIEGRR
jgi:quercetin dioxygenase-like cupin family protein